MSQPSKPMKPVDIDLSKINIDKLKVKKYQNGQETKQCRITYDFGNSNKKEFYVLTPLATVPFGLTIAKENEGEAPRKFKKYSLDFNVSGTPELDEFRQLIEKFDNKNIDYILSQSAAWWGKSASGKPYSRDTIADACYGSMIKRTPEEKGDYPDRFKMKLPFYEGMPRFKVYDAQNKEIKWVKQSVEGEPPELDWSWAQQNMQIEAIMECEALWEVNKKVYCTFKAKQIRVYPPVTLQECAFGDPIETVTKSVAKLSTNDSKPSEAESKVQEPEAEVEEKVRVKVEDDDEEDLEEDLEEGDDEEIEE